MFDRVFSRLSLLGLSILLLASSAAAQEKQDALATAVETDPVDLIRQYIDPVVVDEFNPDVTGDMRKNEDPKRGGVLRLRSPADYQELNPLTSTGLPERMVQLMVFDALVGQDLETLEFFPKMAWYFAKADLVKPKGEEVIEGTILKLGDEENPESELVFVPGARRYTFNKSDVAEVTEDGLKLTDKWGGKEFKGRVKELIHTYEVNEGHSPSLSDKTRRLKVGELDTWRDQGATGFVDRPFQKRECAFYFGIRDGIRWHDGKPFTAEDVKFSFETLMNVNVEAQHLRNYYQHIIKCEILDDGKTVYFENEKSYFRQFDFVAGLYLIPRHVFNPEQYGGDDLAFAEAFNVHPYREHPVGMGPYKISEWRKNEFLTIVRNDDYWANKLPEGSIPLWSPKQPYMDEIRWIIIPEKTASLKELQKGNLDADLDVEPDTWFLDETNSEQFTDRFVRARSYGFMFTYVGFNMARAIFQDPIARMAVSMLIPREKIAQDIHNGLATPVSGPFYSRGPGYDRSIEAIQYDPRGAKRLLRRNGWLDRDGDGIVEKTIDGEVVPFEFEYSIHSARDYHQKIADIIKESVEEAGIKMTIRKLDWTVFANYVRDKDFDAVRFAWGATLDPDPYQIWHSTQAENKGDNFVSYKDGRVDEICEEIRETFDPQERWELAREMHAIVAGDQPYAFLFGFYETYFIDRDIRGVRFYPNQYTMDWTEWWWADPERRTKQ